MSSSPPPFSDRSARLVLQAHQVRGRDAAVRHPRRPHTRALFVSATGTGKTLVAIRIAEHLAHASRWWWCRRWTWRRRRRWPGGRTAIWGTW
ncbi:DEAD/DEAH box helicase family protein [Streptomyces sp. NPDC052000]|uniref:DEAD/DEAH box helicase family protein n=1 Tax=Streptomyces sp. NPDC052000 TaxID=3155676 RepID=UPI00344C0E3B